MLTNWKTTGAGILGLLIAVGNLASMLKTGNIDGNILTTNLGVISASIGAIFAKDFNVTGGSV
jgi:hypothetical protein